MCLGGQLVDASNVGLYYMSTLFFKATDGVFFFFFFFHLFIHLFFDCDWCFSFRYLSIDGAYTLYFIGFDGMGQGLDFGCPIRTTGADGEMCCGGGSPFATLFAGFNQADSGHLWKREGKNKYI
ncbi:hypothetical protein AA313_de0203490 [Arthrobotrys entomopaga]|nr:hypothetical protein AA313_de0203490 [Arthrobotrys entomopaga]